MSSMGSIRAKAMANADLPEAVGPAKQSAWTRGATALR